MKFAISMMKLKVKMNFIKEVDYVDLTWLINKENFDDNDLWDENIFLYLKLKILQKDLKIKIKNFYIKSYKYIPYRFSFMISN